MTPISNTLVNDFKYASHFVDGNTTKIKLLVRISYDILGRIRIFEL